MIEKNLELNDDECWIIIESLGNLAHFYKKREFRTDMIQTIDDLNFKIMKYRVHNLESEVSDEQ